MAAQAQPNTSTRREEITFPPNVAVTVSMKYTQPRLVSGRSGDRYLFTTTDNRIFFCDPPVASQIAGAAINTNEDFTITRLDSGKRGEPASWRVERIAPPAVTASGEQADGTFVVPRDPDAGAPAKMPPARASEHQSSMTLAQEAKFAVDAFAEVLQYGLSQHGGKVKPEEIQRIFTTVYIQRKGAA